MTINDGPQGEASTYRMHVGYCDEFYSVAEFHFHAPARRSYRAEIVLDRGSAVDLLVHNVSLDDVLAGTVRRALKTKTTLASACPAAKAALAERQKKGHKIPPPLTAEERMAKDAAIWNGLPPVNTQGSTFVVGHGGYGSVPGVRAGSDKLTGEQILAEFGPWLPVRSPKDIEWAGGVRPEDVFLYNPKLRLVYTIDDLRQRRPLPDPYPLKDDGAGVFFPDGEPATGAAWTPIGNRVHELHRDYYNRIGGALRQYKERGENDAAHDAAVTLVRYAYAFPTFDYGKYLTSSVHDPGPFNRDYSCRRRETVAFFLPHYPMYVDPLMYWYDELFDFIRGNQRLADSVRRFVPWVKTPEDVVRLVDVYLVQTVAKRILRYHYHTDPMEIGNLATVVGDRHVTDPWMEWLFSRTFIYPLPVGGIQDGMISGTNREGTEFVGSTYYAQGEGASRVAASLDRYLQAGGNPKYDLSDQRRYPKPAAHLYWRLENVVAGYDFLRIGDVCGPDKGPGHTLRDLGFAQLGWQWTRDPKFAFILKHCPGRDAQAGGLPAEIDQAAAKQARAPWLENRSRVLPTWAGILESGMEHDDYRFRRAAYVRVGFGVGHEHKDTLDLQIVAHGLPMTIDGGQRSGYSSPADASSWVHNTVLVDGAQAYRHAWVTALADHGGARYVAAEAVPPGDARLMRRQVALVDVDEGRGSQKLEIAQQLPGAELTKDVVTPDAYVFDVFRAGGGQHHTYCFHGPLNDDFAWNATAVGPAAKGAPDEAQFMGRFHRMPELSLIGDAPAALEATWRMALEVDGPGQGEKEMLGKNYVADGRRKFTRLHLLGVAGARAMRGEAVCQQWKYHFTNLMVRKQLGEKAGGDVFVAMVEAYAGEPCMKACRELPVAANEQDARRAVAVEVQTRGGHRDVCFADGRPERLREIRDAGLKVAGEFAFYSTDAAGLRQATLVGGQRLEGPQVQLIPTMAERCGKVTRVDYLEKKIWLDQPWAARRDAGVLEIGIPGHKTTYTATSVEPAQGGCILALDRGGDYFRSQVLEVNEGEGLVETAMRPLVECIDHDRDGWAASDDAMKTFWRATYLGNGRFKLSGAPVSKSAFGSEGVLRLWEFGAGDEVRQSTSASLRRIKSGVYEIMADAPVAVALRGSGLKVLEGERSVKVLPAAGGWQRVEVSAGRAVVGVELVP